MTPDPATDNLACLYPELGRNGTLQSTLQTAVHQAGYGLDVLPERAPGWWRCGARVDGDSRTTNALLGIAERAFIVNFWERGVMMAKGTTTSLDAVVSAIGAWQSGATLARLRSACPFVDYSPLAEAHERGDAVEAQWTSYRHTTARHIDHELIEAAYAQPQLRALFPFHSHRTLNFSRCTGFPYTHDIPVITPANGSYRVTWWHTRSPHGPADIGEADIPDDAVALVIALLPHNCGPAVAGTAEDLDNSDST
ncbi:DUF6193 family natural product biosynthesis protein [Streptomyces platensis]|uniref:DUF6193 family natural product biosynthesis protein n=1 Tax=Streptomyces platensis TaxID=58346 RepID=UPI003869B159|nr:DUF6193 family natural product biosynthesis protein [Streptomyces platensis]